MAEDDYDLLPHTEIMRLKAEVKELKDALARREGRNPLAKKESEVSTELASTMKGLSESINTLMAVFQRASRDIDSEDHQASRDHVSDMNSNLDNLNEKMEKLLSHNEEIAKGILVVAEMMKEHLPAINNNTRIQPQQRPVQMQMQPLRPEVSISRPGATLPDFGQPGQNVQAPLPPPPSYRQGVPREIPPVPNDNSPF